MGKKHEHWIAEAYDAFGGSMFRHAMMILADADLAEEVVQQVFTKVLCREDVKDITRAGAYLHTIVRREAYEALARKRKGLGISREEKPLLEPVDANMQKVEEQEVVESALRQLTPEQREVVHFKIYEKKTFAEIAEILDIPPNTAASRYRYALERLRELLPAWELEYE